MGVVGRWDIQKSSSTWTSLVPDRAATAAYDSSVPRIITIECSRRTRVMSSSDDCICKISMFSNRPHYANRQYPITARTISAQDATSMRWGQAILPSKIKHPMSKSDMWLSIPRPSALYTRVFLLATKKASHMPLPPAVTVRRGSLMLAMVHRVLFSV